MRCTPSVVGGLHGGAVAGDVELLILAVKSECVSREPGLLPHPLVCRSRSADRQGPRVWIMSGTPSRSPGSRPAESEVRLEAVVHMGYMNMVPSLCVHRR